MFLAVAVFSPGDFGVFSSLTFYLTLLCSSFPFFPLLVLSRSHSNSLHSVFSTLCCVLSFFCFSFIGYGVGLVQSSYMNDIRLRFWLRDDYCIAFLNNFPQSKSIPNEVDLFCGGIVLVLFLSDSVLKRSCISEQFEV